MRKNVFASLFFCLFLSLASFHCLAIETLSLDPAHTYVAWRIKHFDFSEQTGKWYATGTLLIDKENLKASKVNATIHIANIVTGIPELDDHLKSKLFFEVNIFPEASFVSTQVKLTGKSTAEVTGLLNLHGVSKPVVLNVRLNKIGENPINNKQTAGFSATATIKRSDFGINTLIPGLSDEVQLSIEVEATAANK